jgi:hypothetical protein
MKPSCLALPCLLAALASTGRVAHAGDKEQCIEASERGQALSIAHHPVAARPEFVTCARTVCPALILKDCADELATVELSIATVVVSARDTEGHQLPDTRVWLDGAPWADALTGRAVAVDPGEHRFRFEHAGRPPIEQSVIVAEGARLHPVNVVFEAPPHPLAPVPIAAYVLGGVGVVALGLTAYFGVSALTQHNSLLAHPSQVTQSDIDAVNTKRVLSDVSLGVGLLSLGAATWLILSRPRVGRSTSVGMRTVPGGAMGTWSTTF